jgi:hypothetical protein
VTSEGKGWGEFFTEHFPRGDSDAELLWTDWRTRLLKDETPGSGVVITHGQGFAHWKRVEPGNKLCIDLEMMWDDYGTAVNHFIEMLQAEPERRDKALARWHDLRWSVQNVIVKQSGNVSVSAAFSATAMGPPNK